MLVFRVISPTRVALLFTRALLLIASILCFPDSLFYIRTYTLEKLLLEPHPHHGLIWQSCFLKLGLAVSVAAFIVTPEQDAMHLAAVLTACLTTCQYIGGLGKNYADMNKELGPYHTLKAEEAPQSWFFTHALVAYLEHLVNTGRLPQADWQTAAAQYVERCVRVLR